MNPCAKDCIFSKHDYASFLLKCSEHYITENLSMQGGKGNQLSLAAHPQPVGLMEL